MQATDVHFTGSVPDYYDRLLGPNIFIDYARDLAKRAKAVSPKSILELAAGTGIVSREIKSVLPDANLVVTDLNQPMLDVAAAKFQPDEGVEFREADAMALPFDDACFDLVACQFGVMFFPDKVQSFKEAQRLLKPGGHYVFNTWGEMSANPFAMVADKCARRFFPENPPGFYKAPFSYPDPEVIIADLKAAGWKDVEFEMLTLRKAVADWGDFARGLVFGNPLKAEIEARGGVDPEDVVAALKKELTDAFSGGDGCMQLQAGVYTAAQA
jgi:ubiquinone/menaquinone biosynthesis C-methylase UbiE